MQVVGFEDLSVGMRVEEDHTVTEEELRNYVRLSGDWNPLHTDDEVGKASRFGKRISYGLLTSLYIGKILGTKLPGLGSMCLSQTMDYVKPVCIGDFVRVVVEVVSKHAATGVVTVTTNAYRLKELSGSGLEAELVLKGKALVMMLSELEKCKCRRPEWLAQEGVDERIKLLEEQLQFEHGEIMAANKCLDDVGVPSNGEEGVGKRQTLTLPQRIKRLTALSRPC